MTDDSEAFCGGTLHSLVSPSSSYPSGIKEIISSCLMVFGYEIINVLVNVNKGLTYGWSTVSHKFDVIGDYRENHCET